MSIDTLKLSRRWQEAGIARDTADQMVSALKDELTDSDLVTKKDLEIALAPIKSELRVTQWMIRLILGGIVALIIKAFFG